MHCKRIAARLAAAMLLVTTLITPASALNGVVSTGGSVLRLRAEANTGSSILKNLANGAQIEILDTLESGWYQVKHQGTVGYVASEYVTMGDGNTAVYVQVVDGPLNIRSAPSADAEKVGSLAVGKVVEVKGLADGWYQINAGYICADYVTEVDASMAQQAEPAYVRVVNGPLNIRSGPSADTDKVGSLPTGKVVEVKGLSNGWYQISSGYICADYVTESSAAEMQSSGKGQEIANYALQFVGCRYVYGGASPKGFDCSGLTSYVYKQFGYSLNRSASAQLSNGRSVSRGELKPGDLVMFATQGGNRASHVGIYIGGNQFVHAANSKKGVVVSGMGSSYYASRFVGARRIVD